LDEAHDVFRNTVVGGPAAGGEDDPIAPSLTNWLTGVDAERSSFIVGGGDYAAAGAILGICSNNYGKALPARVVSFFNGGKEGIHIEVGDDVFWFCLHDFLV